MIVYENINWWGGRSCIWKKDDTTVETPIKTDETEKYKDEVKELKEEIEALKAEKAQ